MSTEQDSYHELCFYTLAHRDPAFIHQHAVDAFTAQHADEQTKPIAITFALIGLYLHVEQALSGKQVQHMHMALARHKQPWPRFLLPESRGSVTVVDVMALAEGPDRDERIHEWCVSVWQAYGASRASIISLLERQPAASKLRRPGAT